MTVTVTPKTLIRLLKRDLEVNRFVIYIWGPPGVGKTECVLQIAAELGLPVRVLSVALEHPHTLGGFPVPSWREKQMEKFPPKVIREMERGVLFLDDFAAAEPQQQRTALSLTTYHSVGDFKLGEGVRIVFASNRPSDLSYVVKPSFAVLNRCKHYQLLPSLDDWKEWLTSVSVPLSDFDASMWSEAVPRETAVLVSLFLTFFPQHFFTEPSNLDVLETIAFPTPRSWTNFIRDFGLLLKDEGYGNGRRLLSDLCQTLSEDISVLLSGWVGSTPLSSFLQFLSVDQNLLEEATRNWGKLTKLPTHEQALYSFLIYLSLDAPKREEFVNFLCQGMEKESLAILSFFFRNDERVVGRHRVVIAASSFQLEKSRKRGGKPN